MGLGIDVSGPILSFLVFSLKRCDIIHHQRSSNARGQMKSLISKNDKIEVLKDIRVPSRYFNRIDTGNPIINEIFGGSDTPGILPGGTIFLTGTPGAGKSTFALLLADMISHHAQKTVLLNVGEENRYMIKIRADRMKLKQNFIVSQFEQIDELIKFMDDAEVEVLVQDSLQSMSDGDLRGDAKLKSVAKKFQAFKEESAVTQIIIGQSTKSGQFAGPNEIKHDLDVHAHIRLDTDTGNRIFELQKNRFGPGAIPYEFGLTGSGIDFHQAALASPDDEEEGSSRSDERRKKIVGLIKEKFIEGEKITGYCFERFDVDCSGGFWRSMVAKAVKEMEKDGITIVEGKVDGRTANWIEGM